MCRQFERRHTLTDHKSPSFADALGVYLLDLEARNASRTTITYYRYHLGALLTTCQAAGVVALGDVTANHIRNHIAGMARQGMGGYSQLGAYRAARAFFNFAIREGWVTATPVAKLSAPRVENRAPEIYSQEQLKKILNGCRNSRDRALVLLLLDTGLRRQEAYNLCGDDVNLETGAVMVRQGKGKKDRLTFAGAKTRRALARYYMETRTPGPGQRLWVSMNDGTDLSFDGFVLIFRRLSDRIGFPVRPHSFRRTFATESLRRGLPLETLRVLMGHADMSVMRRYVRLLPEDLRDAQRQFGVVDGML